MKKLHAFITMSSFLFVIPFSYGAESSVQSEQVINSNPCKNIAEGESTTVLSSSGEKVNLVCHHLLPQENEINQHK